MIRFWVPGRPKPKERPRLGRGRRVFTPQATLDAEAMIAGYWKKYGDGEVEGPVSVIVDYFEDGQWITVKPAGWTSKLRGDIDNYVKTTLDGLQSGGAFNDVKVVEVWAAKQSGSGLE